MEQSRYNNTANEQLAGVAPSRCGIISKDYPPA